MTQDQEADLAIRVYPKLLDWEDSLHKDLHGDTPGNSLKRWVEQCASVYALDDTLIDSSD